MIEFNIPFKTNLKINNKIDYIKKVELFLKKTYRNEKIFLTNSATSSLEIIAELLDIKDNDEIITASYTLSSTILPFVKKGAIIKFVDIDPQTMCIDEKKIYNAITNKTKACILIHYSGVSCNLDNNIFKILKEKNIKIIEDASQAFLSNHNNYLLGTFGDFSCISFQEAKIFSMGEGGALIINTNNRDYEKALVIRDKGTNRNKLINKQIAKYEWVGTGSSYNTSNINAAYLYKQIKIKEKILNKRRKIWFMYKKNLSSIVETQKYIGNFSFFYILCKDEQEREKLISFLKKNKINVASHFVPLHTALGAKKFKTFFVGKDIFTTKCSLKILRLPIYYNISFKKIKKIIKEIKKFYAIYNM